MVPLPHPRVRSQVKLDEVLAVEVEAFEVAQSFSGVGGSSSLMTRVAREGYRRDGSSGYATCDDLAEPARARCSWDYSLEEVIVVPARS